MPCLYSFAASCKVFLSLCFEFGDCSPYCVKCGTSLKEDGRFCAVCGAAVPNFTSKEYTVSDSNLVERVREMLNEGNVTRVIVKDEAGKTFLEILATVGAVGLVVAPCLAALGVIAALVTNFRIIVNEKGRRFIRAVLREEGISPRSQGLRLGHQRAR